MAGGRTTNNMKSGAFSANIMLLQADGMVLVHNAYQAEWLRFTPDPKHGYAGGTWTLPDGSNVESDMSNTRQFFSTGVLQHGRVNAIVGEYSTGGATRRWARFTSPEAILWSALTTLDKPASVNFVDGDAPRWCCPTGASCSAAPPVAPRRRSGLRPASRGPSPEPRRDPTQHHTGLLRRGKLGPPRGRQRTDGERQYW